VSITQVSVIVLEPVSMFEFGVAVEVFGLDRTADGIPPVDFRVCSPTPRVPLAVKEVSAASVIAEHELSAVAGSDLVIVCATPIRPAAGYPQEMLAALRTAHVEGATLLSLCSGAFALGAAGLLNGRRSTTHWMHTTELQETYPLTEVKQQALFVQDGGIVTSAGTAGAIDASLELVRQEWGASTANKIARRMVVPPQRDGGQLQFVEMPIPSAHSDSLSPLLTWVLTHLDQEHTATSLARKAVMSERTFSRRFMAETGTTPHRWVTQQRVLAARRLLEESDLGVEQIATRVGFSSAVVLRENFRRAVGVAPKDYRRGFAISRPGNSERLAS
jgi:AraC family transcriptional activator FtrA